MGATAIATVMGVMAFAPGRPAVAHVSMTQREISSAVKTYRIPEGSIAVALTRLADESGVRMIYRTQLTKDLETQGLSGTYTLTEALEALLSGTGLGYRVTGDGRAVAIILAQNDTGVRSDTGPVPLPPIDIGKKKQDEKIAYSADRGAITEGSGTYTTPLVTVAGKVPLPRKEIPQSVSVVTRQQLDDQNLHTMQDALSQVPGVSAIPNDAVQGQPASRGYSMNLMNDGVPSYAALQGYQQFDMAIYDRVEVLKGPSGLFNGTGNPGGTINVVKKRPRDEFKLKGEFTGGSWDNYRGMVDVTGPISEDKSLRYRAVLLHGDRRFFYDRAQEWKWLGYGAIEYDIAPSTLANFSYTRQYYVGPTYFGQPTYAFPALGGASNIFLNVSRSTNSFPSWSQYHLDTQELSARIEHRFGDDDWVARVVWNRRDQGTDLFDAYPTTGVNLTDGTLSYARRHSASFYHLSAIDSNISGAIPLFGRLHRVTLGYNYDRWTYESKSRSFSGVTKIPFYVPELVPQPLGPMTSGNQGQVLQHGAYGQLRLNPVEPLTFILGGRLSNVYSKNRQSEPSPQGLWVDGVKSTKRFTPYVAGIVQLNDQINIYGSYSDIFVPTSSQRADGSTLDPRIGGQYEAGIKAELFDKKLNASAAWFDIRDKNRAMSDPANPGYSLQSGEVESTGVETEFSGKPFAQVTLPLINRALPGLDVVGGYTYMRTQYLVDRNFPGRSINSFYPTHLFKIWGKYDFDGELRGLSIGGGLTAQSAVTGALNSWNETRRQPPYVVVGAMLSYKLDEHLSLHFNINNIFDQKYYTRVGSAGTSNIPGEPRNFMVTLRGEY